MHKDLLVTPEFYEEHFQKTKEYTIHSLGLILGYSRQAAVEVVYLHYYATKDSFFGIQVERTLAPNARGTQVPLVKVKNELQRLKKLTDKTFVIKSRRDL